jgi:hypothetical protein
VKTFSANALINNARTPSKSANPRRRVKDRPARTGRNPATGAAIQIAASKKVAFRVAKELKEAV